MKNVTRLDFIITFIVGLNWSLFCIIMIMLFNSLGSLYYIYIIEGLIIVNLVSYMQNISIRNRMIMLLIIDVVVILTVCAILFMFEGDTRIIILVSVIASNLIVRSFVIKYKNIYTQHYGKFTQKIDIMFERTSMNAGILGSICGLLISYYLGLNAIVIVFIILEIFSMFYTIKFYQELIKLK